MAAYEQPDENFENIPSQLQSSQGEQCTRRTGLPGHEAMTWPFHPVCAGEDGSKQLSGFFGGAKGKQVQGCTEKVGLTRADELVTLAHTQAPSVFSFQTCSLTCSHYHTMPLLIQCLPTCVRGGSNGGAQVSSFRVWRSLVSAVMPKSDLVLPSHFLTI